MKVTIIGSTGFVGSHLLTEALLRGHQVLALARNAGKIRFTDKLLTVKNADVLNVSKLTQLLSGQDAVLSAFNPGWGHSDLYTSFIAGSKAVQEAAKRANVKRLMIIGGAGSLEIKPGIQLVDTPDFPEEWKQGALAARDYFDMLQTEVQLSWTFLSPAVEMHPGTSGIKTGNYRIGTDQPVFDSQGISRISVEDIAVAILDELENQNFINRRFTVAY